MLSSTQLLVTSQDYRKTLLKYIRNHFHRYGKHPGMPDSNAQISTQALQFVTGIFPSLYVSRLISRIDFNNMSMIGEQSCPAAFIAFAAKKFGMSFLPDRYKNVAHLYGISRCLTSALFTFARAYDETCVLTSGIMDDLLNLFCLKMYDMGMLSDLTETASIIDIAAEYMTDVIWYMSEPDDKLNPLFLLNCELSTRFNLGTSPNALDYDSLHLAYSAMLDLDAIAASATWRESASSKWNRWYSNPLDQLNSKLEMIARAAMETAASHSLCGREVFPHSCRVSYRGKWIINECHGSSYTFSNGESSDLIYMSYNKCNVHSLNPLKLFYATRDLSTPQCIREGGWTSFCTTSVCGYPEAYDVYPLAWRLCHAISMNYNRLNRITGQA